MFEFPAQLFQDLTRLNHLNAYAAIENIINENLRTMQRVSKIGIGTSTTEYLYCSNALVRLLYFMLQFENPELPEIKIKLQREELLGNLPNVAVIEGYPTPGSQKMIQIIWVKAGGTRISELPTATELKNYSLALQRSSQHRIRVFKRNDDLITIYTNVWTWNIYYKLATLLPTFFPDALPNCSEDIKAAGLALVNDQYDKYKEHVTAWWTAQKIEENKILNALKGFLKGRRTKQIEIARKNEQDTLLKIENYYAEISRLLREKEKTEIQLLGLHAVTQNEDDEALQDTAEYLKNNPSITSYNFSGSTIQLRFRTPLTYTDTAAIEHNYIKRDHYGDPVIQWLFKETFLDEKYEIYTTSAMILNLDGCEVSKNNIPIYSDREMPQPHIMRHNCWGNNRTHIQNALRAQDLIGAISQCIATNMNLNATDSTVISTFVTDLRINYSAKKVIKNTQTGEWLSYREYKERFEKDEKEKKDETTRTE